MDAQSSPSVPVVVTRDLSRRFGSVVALERVSFEIAPGEIFGVVGADGSGKTTLLQMLAAILDPTAGSCQVLGFDSVRQADAVTARIGYMSQGFTLYERLTVEENLAFAAAVRSVDPEVLHARRQRLLKMAGLERFTDRRADQLSGGMKKKLALCTNLIHEPRVLLLDEPSLGVDPLSRRELWTLLEDFRRHGASIVVATSYMDEADRCDRLVFLHEGRTLALGSPHELKERVAGTVFEIDTPDPAGMERQLAANPAVRGFARLPGKVRFQLVKATEASPASSSAVPGARAVAPQLEDLFTAVAPAGGGPSAVESAASERTAALRVVGGSSISAPTGSGMAAVAEHRSTGPGPAQAVLELTTVRACGVICRFGDFIAVNDVSLELKAGEVFGFLGPNGAGKTTLIRILCGLQRFQSGEVEVAAVDVRRDVRSLRRRIGYMSQRFSLYPDLTVTENLEFFAGVYELSAPARSAALAWAVETAGLQGLGRRKVNAVSGAVRQRLALACSVMHRPRVLFLDEPTSGVDPLSRHRFWRLVHDLAGEGITAFVTTHYLEEAAYCHRLGLMFQGRLIGLGPLAQLREREGLAEASSVEDLFLRVIERAREAA
jgi:ABC-2 type transport system ATP-binding protein